MDTANSATHYTSIMSAIEQLEAERKNRARRSRTRFSEVDTEVLNEAFSENPYPGYDARCVLAERLDVPEARVAVWFQNRRTRTRKTHRMQRGKPGPRSAKTKNEFWTGPTLDDESALPSPRIKHMRIKPVHIQTTVTPHTVTDTLSTSFGSLPLSPVDSETSDPDVYRVKIASDDSLPSPVPYASPVRGDVTQHDEDQPLDLSMTSTSYPPSPAACYPSSPIPLPIATLPMPLSPLMRSPWLQRVHYDAYLKAVAYSSSLYAYSSPVVFPEQRK